MSPTPGAPPAGLARRAGAVLVAVAPQWVVARLIVLGALGLARLLADRTHPSAAAVARVHQGLLGWDAGWYEGIARFGYGRLGPQSLRFFPLFPLLGRGLGAVPGVGDGPALVLVANAAALVAAALLFVLVRRETGDLALAQRSVWLLCLAPSAFVLVMGYAEGVLLALSVGCFLAVRRGSGRAPWAGRPRPAWCWAAALGLAAGATRPVGLALVLAVGVEAVRWWRTMGGAERLLAVVATLAPLAGAVAFLAWSAAAFGNFWLPLKVQSQAAHHGGLSDPLATLAHDAWGVMNHHFGTALHVPWVVVVVVLLVVCWRRWPASYGAFATGVVAVALSGTNLDSFERYALSAFPLVLAAAGLIGRPWVERGVLTLIAAGLAGYAVLAFMNVSVP
ncbi:MAG: hypothetical protein ACLP9C_00635 [Acidimicrobiales bacterium]